MTASPAGSGSVRNPALSLGVLLGVFFSGVGLAWLLLANRAPHLGQFASERNLALAIAFGLLGLVLGPAAAPRRTCLPVNMTGANQIGVVDRNKRASSQTAQSRERAEPQVLEKMVGPCGLEPQTSTVSR